jgi:ABC-2 type transport system ATP-binding protein
MRQEEEERRTAARGVEGEGPHALDVLDLVKRYPTGTEALRGVSLAIEPGEFFGLLGPNDTSAS